MVNTKVLKGFISSWKPQLSTCYTAVYICLLCTTVSGVYLWKVKLPSHWKSFSGISAGKAEESKEGRQQRWKTQKNESASELLLIFLNGIIFKCSKWHFPLKGLDFSRCSSARCDQIDDQSLSSRLWFLGLYPKGFPGIAPISGTPSKMWQALLSAFLRRKGL